MPSFRSFRSTVTPFLSRQWPSNLKLLVDPFSGAPVGIESVNANGPHGIWTPVDLTAAQLAAPTADMIADLNATYRLNVAPYTRYQSDGTTLNATASGATPSGLFNVSAQTLPNWRKALANVRAGTGRAKLILLGDSTTAGAGAGTSGSFNYVGAFAKNYPRDFVPLLRSVVPISDNSFVGTQQNAVSYGTYDTRVVLGTGWAPSSATLGASLFLFTTGVASKLTFTPASQIDSFVVWYLKLPAGGSFTVDIDGAASLGTVTTVNAGQLLASSPFTVAKGAHAINLNAQSDGNVNIVGVVAWDSTVPAVDLIQSGSNGATTSTFTSTVVGSSPPFVITAFAPDLTVIDLTINDSNANTPLATYQSQMQSIITTAKLSGDVLLVVGAPSNSVQATNGTLDQYIAVLQSLALLNNCGLLNLKTRWVSYAVTNPIFPYFDSLHPGPLGYQDIASAVFGAIGNP